MKRPKNPQLLPLLVNEIAEDRTLRPSGIPWAPWIPKCWKVLKAHRIFKQLSLDVRKIDEVVTCFRDGQVTLRSKRRMDGFTLAEKEVGYQGVRAGHLVVHSMDAFAGAIGVSEDEGKCSPEYIVLEHARDGVITEYYGLLLRMMATHGFIVASCPSVRERAPRIRFSGFAEFELPLPSKSEQQAIAQFVNEKTDKINEVIKALEESIQLANEEISALVFPSEENGSKEMRLDSATDIITRHVIQKDNETYTRLGLYNRGRGVFHKDPSEGDDMGESDFCWVEEGDCILSGQFAWEGAVALADKKDEDCVVSHRYHLLRGRANVALTEYIFALLCTKHGNFLLNDNSRGAAGRNRPLNIYSLMKEKFPVPDMETQKAVAHAVHANKKLAAEAAQITALLKEYRSTLIYEAVTGKIDLRAA